MESEWFYKLRVVCQCCKVAVRYVSGKTSNMLTHIRRHQPEVLITGARQEKTTGVKKCVPAAFNQPLHVRADRFYYQSIYFIPQEMLFSCAADCDRIPSVFNQPYINI